MGCWFHCNQDVIPGYCFNQIKYNFAQEPLKDGTTTTGTTSLKGVLQKNYQAFERQNLMRASEQAEGMGSTPLGFVDPIFPWFLATVPRFVRLEEDEQQKMMCSLVTSATVSGFVTLEEDEQQEMCSLVTSAFRCQVDKEVQSLAVTSCGSAQAGNSPVQEEVQQDQG
ncbi:hypothetical protein HGM15179_009430 [Zosterops borbonicus]|uniref:Uncharacterized protein n=1 Tax=Zosterops borbonicus TaxID=364589 RepID=A0A8K1GGK1_9PASS|nr:hypothetical protein HGM15179_009430 [Zosterops borbonicus]